MKVKLNDLLTVTEKIIKHLEGQGITEIELEKDYYWDFSDAEIYDMNKDPTGLEVGQLYDDMGWLDKILHGETEPYGYALVWLSSIYRYIGINNSA